MADVPVEPSACGCFGRESKHAASARSAGVGRPEHIDTLSLYARTGDIVLFSSKHRASNITKFFTNSIWDHVGLVVRPNSSRKTAYLIEWSGSLCASPLTQRLTDCAQWGSILELWLMPCRGGCSNLEVC